MPSVSQVKRILSPCLKEQSSDRVGELLVDIRIFIGSEGLWLKVQERRVGEYSGMSLGARTSRDIVRVAKIVELPANETTDWA